MERLIVKEYHSKLAQLLLTELIEQVNSNGKAERLEDTSCGRIGCVR